MKFGKVILLLIAGALLATPVLAEGGKGYGKRLLAKTEAEKTTATDNPSCPMGGPHFAGHVISGHKHHS